MESVRASLPQPIAEFIESNTFRFNEKIEDNFIWKHNINGVYTAKSGYLWLLGQSESIVNHPGMDSWSWLWKLKIPEKFKMLIWLAGHNAVPTLSLLHHRNIAPSATCTRCGEEEESTLHCLRDCSFSKNIWHDLGFVSQEFFLDGSAINWIKANATGAQNTNFLAGLWWVWRHRNQMCLSNETWTTTRINLHIQNSINMIQTAFHTTSVLQPDRMVRWNNNNFNCVVLNVDGSCLGSPIRAGYGGIFRNSAGLFLSGFSGYLAATSDILFAELTAIHCGLRLAVDAGIDDMVCYSDSLLSTQLLTGHASPYHAYAVIIQDIKDILQARNFTLNHCLREGNQCADFFAKLGATSNEDFVNHVTPPNDLLPLIRTDAMGTFFPRA